MLVRRILFVLSIAVSLFVVNLLMACECEYGDRPCSRSCEQCTSFSCFDCESTCDLIPGVGEGTGCKNEMEQTLECAANHSLCVFVPGEDIDELKVLCAQEVDRERECVRSHCEANPFSRYCSENLAQYNLTINASLP